MEDEDNLSGSVLMESDLVIDWCKVHHGDRTHILPCEYANISTSAYTPPGKKDSNPVDRVRFYSK